MNEVKDIGDQERERLLLQEKARNWYIDEFLEYLSVERYLAGRTVAEYSDDLRIFIEYFQDNFADGMVLADVDARTVREFLQ